MPADVLLGLQWGDEGKGKIVDYIAPGYQVVARFQGGPNAGHTLVLNGVKHVLHQIPSGIFHPEITNIIGNGVVLDPITFKKEIDKLHAAGVNPHDNLIISQKTQIILPTHRLLDAASEAAKGAGKIGSTLKGISPAYQDKYARRGLRVGDLTAPDFLQRYNEVKEQHLRLLDYFHFEGGNLKDEEERFFEAVELLKSFKTDQTEYIINQALKDGKKVLAEGAQGALLDIDFGSYPFVTSSSTTTAGACTGLGIAPRYINQVHGIFKAYCTRVGSGPFPTELHEETGEAIRKAGNEFGSTTGRPRRTGWLDLPALQYAVMLNGATQLLMMKADVLNSFDTIKVCTAYRLANGSMTRQMPHNLGIEPVEPIYTEMPGWKTDIQSLMEPGELPKELTDYIAFIEKVTEVPISLLSTGPDRTQTIRLKAAV